MCVCVCGNELQQAEEVEETEEAPTEKYEKLTNAQFEALQRVVVGAGRGRGCRVVSDMMSPCKRNQFARAVQQNGL